MRIYLMWGNRRRDRLYGRVEAAEDKEGVVRENKDDDSTDFQNERSFRYVMKMGFSFSWRRARCCGFPFRYHRQWISEDKHIGRVIYTCNLSVSFRNYFIALSPSFWSPLLRVEQPQATVFVLSNVDPSSPPSLTNNVCAISREKVAS
jgi:hypothetical protein